MRRRSFIQAATLAVAMPLRSNATSLDRISRDKRRILAFGSGNFSVFLKHIVKYIPKNDPKICYIPTATGDSLTNITNWYAACEALPVRPYVLKTFISSYNASKSFEEQLMAMDAVFVGGGNTLNMLSVWKAQGIDTLLRKAYDNGIVMAGGSAGSLCWFESGTTDSRPKELSTLSCMGWIKGSHCPHYDVEGRRALYHDLIMSGGLPAGYACDNLAGLYFENEKFVRSVSLNDKSYSYYVDVVDGKIIETRLPTEKL